MDSEILNRKRVPQSHKQWLSHLIQKFIPEYKHHRYLKNGLIKLYNDSLFGVPMGKTLTITVNELISDILIFAIAKYRSSKSKGKIEEKTVIQELQFSITPRMKAGDIEDAIRILMRNYFDHGNYCVWIKIQDTMIRVDEKEITSNKHLSPDEILTLQNYQNNLSDEEKDIVMKTIARSIDNDDGT